MFLNPPFFLHYYHMAQLLHVRLLTFTVNQLEWETQNVDFIAVIFSDAFMSQIAVSSEREPRRKLCFFRTYEIKIKIRESWLSGHLTV